MATILLDSQPKTKGCVYSKGAKQIISRSTQYPPSSFNSFQRNQSENKAKPCRFRSRKIRFSGIDAPESYFNGKKQICYQNLAKIYCGDLSKKKLENKINGKTVFCEAEKNEDIYGRILAECFVGNESISRYMVKNGYAFDYPRYSNKKFSGAENFAKKNKLGLWKMRFEYPWIWRKKNR